MVHDIIEAIDYCRKNDRDTIATKNFDDGTWCYTCKGLSPKDYFIWNQVSRQWETLKPPIWDEELQARRLQEGPECRMTREEALKCLQTIPNKTEELLETPVEIEAFEYSRVGGEITTLIGRQMSGDRKGEWLYGCRYKRVFYVWNLVLKAWEPYKLGVRKAHCLTEAEAKECLRSVPTLAELDSTV